MELIIVKILAYKNQWVARVTSLGGTKKGVNRGRRGQKVVGRIEPKGCGEWRVTMELTRGRVL